MSEDAIERPQPQPVDAKVGELTPNSKAVNVIVKVVSKGEVRSTTSGRDYSEHKVLEALVGDETGCIYLNLWDDNIEKVNEGNGINIKNGIKRKAIESWVNNKEKEPFLTSAV